MSLLLAREEDNSRRWKIFGKAPACIIDLKVVVCYLRFNDAEIPSDAEKIISNCTSASGALSSLLGVKTMNLIVNASVQLMHTISFLLYLLLSDN